MATFGRRNRQVDNRVAAPTSPVKGPEESAHHEEKHVKYLILIYSNPETWGHPSFLRTKEGQALSADERDALTAQLEQLLAELTASGELVQGAALAVAQRTEGLAQPFDLQHRRHPAAPLADMLRAHATGNAYACVSGCMRRLRAGECVGV